MANKIDSNVTGLSFAEETSLKVLPGTPEWYGLCPNSYSDFGGSITNTARNCINPSRQKQKGTVTDNDASGAFNMDFTQNNLQRLLQGFFFADAREKFSTAPLNGTKILITDVDDALDNYNAASGLDSFVANDLLMASGFGNATNNGLSLVTAAVAASVTVSKSLALEATPPAASKIEKCGYQFAAGDLALEATASGVKLTTTVKDLTSLGLNIGEEIFLGGDAVLNQFDNNQGYGRILSIDTNEIILNDTTWAPQTEAGGVKEIRMFFGTVIRNEKDASLIKRRSFNLERTLGEDDDGVMSEYLTGSIPNEFSLKVAQADKLNADLSFVAMDNEQRNGLTGPKLGNRNPSLGEEAYNTSSDIYRIKLSIQDETAINQNALFGFVENVDVNLTNNVEPVKAVGVLGAFEASAGDFEVGGSITAFFSTIEAVQAVRNNEDVGLSIISASNNAGFSMEVPLISLGDGKITVEKDQPVKIPLETMGAENAQGYTMLMSFFPYLPNLAMPN